MRNDRALAFAALVAVALAGCSEPAADPATTSTAGCGGQGGACAPSLTAAPTTAPTSDAPAPTDDPVVQGYVLDESRAPIAGANVTVRETAATTRTDARGAFRVPVEHFKVHTVDAQAPGYVDRTLFTSPELQPLEFILLVDPAARGPYNHTLEFDGHFDCAADTLIIPGSCTLLLSFAGADEPIFSEADAFEFSVDPGWTTVVLDLASEEQPGFEGMRLVVRGAADAEALNSYEQYARFGGGASFSARMEPGQSYDGGAGPVPGNLTGFQVDVYPQGHLYHQACAPVPPGEETCFTGAGAGANLEFKLLVTTFYIEPAPAGFSRL